MLEIQGIEKSFGGLKAVNDCSLEVREGSITGLIGPNGAGKTTLFNIITGHYKPDRGKINFQGDAIEGLAPHQIFKKKVYRTFQITREFAQMTVLENLMIMPEQQSRGKNMEHLVSGRQRYALRKKRSGIRPWKSSNLLS